MHIRSKRVSANAFKIGLTQLMSFCVGADDSLPENILYGVKTAPCGRLSSRPYIQLHNSYKIWSFWQNLANLRILPIKLSSCH